MPRNNTWSLIGAVLVTLAVFVLDALLKFFGTGDPWPSTLSDWERLVIPAVCAGLSAALLPHYSTSELRTGYRVVDSKKDAPVIDRNSPDVPSIVASVYPSSRVVPPGVSPH